MIKEPPEGGLIAFAKACLANAKLVPSKPAGKGKAKGKAEQPAK